jgi:hypothetical protein
MDGEDERISGLSAVSSKQGNGSLLFMWVFYKSDDGDHILETSAGGGFQQTGIELNQEDAKDGGRTSAKEPNEGRSKMRSEEKDEGEREDGGEDKGKTREKAETGTGTNVSKSEMGNKKRQRGHSINKQEGRILAV